MSVDDFPGWPWIFRPKGFKKGKKWMKQMEDRNRDAQDIFVHDDFTSYGVQEVIENMVGPRVLGIESTLMSFRSLLISTES
jgi:hypothetical protein